MQARHPITSRSIDKDRKMKNLIESILNKDLISARESFRKSILTIVESKLSEKKKMVAASITEQTKSPHDRGGADAWYGRKPDPHKIEDGKRVPLTDKKEIEDYHKGYKSEHGEHSDLVKEENEGNKFIAYYMHPSGKKVQPIEVYGKSSYEAHRNAMSKFKAKKPNHVHVYPADKPINTASLGEERIDEVSEKKKVWQPFEREKPKKLDEVSSRLLKKYIKISTIERGRNGKKVDKKSDKRELFVAKATDITNLRRDLGEKPNRPRPKKLNEVSNKLLRNYISKALDDVSFNNYKSGVARVVGYDEKSEKHTAKADRRTVHIRKAVNKLAK